MRGDLYSPAGQNLAGNGPSEHQRRRQPPGEVSPSPNIMVVAVFHIGGVVGVAGPRPHPQPLVIFRALVLIHNDGAKGRAGGNAVQKPAEHLGLVGFFAAGGSGVLPRGPAGHLCQDLLPVNGLPRGQPVHIHADGFCMAAAKD